MRYSPKPIEGYGVTHEGTFYGPSNFGFLNKDPEAWNLAFLSHDFEERPTLKDPKFTTLVRHSVLTKLSDGTLTVSLPPHSYQMIRVKV